MIKYFQEHPETRKKMSESQKGKTSPMKGKYHSLETRRKMSEAKKGKHHSEEHKRKIGEGNKGKSLSEEHKNRIKEARLRRKVELGYINSPETRRKIGEAGKGNTYRLGKYNSKKTKEKISKTLKKYFKENPDERIKISAAQQGIPLSQWKEFISFKPYTLDFNESFKKAIRERDNNCCMICNKSQEELKRQLSVHHIDYNKQNSFPQNCVSLCRTCHMKTNMDRTQWKTFFQKLLKEKYGYQYTQEQRTLYYFN